MSESNDTAYGVIGVIVIIVLVGWALISNAQQQKETNINTVSTAVSDVNDRIDEIYSSATDTQGAITDECNWQADNLSGNIGDVCLNNTIEMHSIDSESDYQLSEDYYVSMLDNTSVEDVVSQLVDDANSNYDHIVSTTEDMVAALNEQCDWIDGNIDSDIASECYDAGNNFDGSSTSPFSASDYLEANQ